MKSLCSAAENWNTNGYTAVVNARLRKLLIDGVIGCEDDRGPIRKPLKPVRQALSLTIMIYAYIDIGGHMLSITEQSC